MPACPYCGRPARLVTGKVVYPHRKDLAHLSFWHCAPCFAYVGCHKNTIKPLGRLANAALRWSKIQAHKAFDRLWREGTKSRGEAYRWLAGELGIEQQDCHIGEFDIAMCKRVVAVCAKLEGRMR